MNQFVGIPVYVKLLLFLLSSMLFIQGFLYATGDGNLQYNTVDTLKEDLYTTTVQRNADTISRDVLDIVNNPTQAEYLVYWHGCEVILDTIRTQNMEAEQGYNTISPEHKKINENYRVFLHEAASVVISCENGGTPDTSKMEEARVKLHQP